MKSYTNAELYGGIVAVIIDRITKWHARIYICTESPITSWFSYNPVINRGLSWSLADNQESYLQYVVTPLIFLVLCACVFVFYRRMLHHKQAHGLLLLSIGAVSNYADRMFYGGVIDWISIHYHAWYWPTFNIADIMICCGIAILFYSGEVS